MSVRELQVLLALCAAAPNVTNAENARKLVRQLAPYLVESSAQRFVSSPYMREIEPCPWEALTAGLVRALLAMAGRFVEFRHEVVGVVEAYVDRIAQGVEHVEAGGAGVEELVASMLGFLEAAAKGAAFWSNEERLRLVQRVQDIVTEPFVGVVDAVFAQDVGGTWRRYVRRYETAGRPLGGMVLRQAVLGLLVASTSLVVTKVEPGVDEDVLDVLLDGRVVTSISPEDHESAGTYSGIAASTIAMLEESEESKSPLALAAKASAIVAYCNCVVLSSTADPNVLYRWLQATISDPVQMACIPLAKSALKILAILAKDPNNSASGFISILQRFIVEGTPSEEVVEIAARCLSYILNKAGQDDTITSLNTLGHVLGDANPEKALKSEALLPFEHQPMASSLSLSGNTDDFRYSVYSNVIQTITGIAAGTKEPTVCCLAPTTIRRDSRFADDIARRVGAAAACAQGPARGQPQDYCSAGDARSDCERDRLRRTQRACAQDGPRCVMAR